MDTTEKYIKMCEEAEEIQKAWNSDKYADFLWLRFSREIILEKTNNLSGTVWLPHQDQFQEILLKDYDIYALTEQFASYVYHRFVLYDELNFTSLEQWWLAFVMHEKYDKIWDNENWIKDR